MKYRVDGRGRMRLGLAVCLLTAASSIANAGLYKTQKQVLKETFPGGFERKTAFLTEEQTREVEKLAKAKLDSKIVNYYVGRDAGGKPMGTAFFDTHVVRTTTETVFILVDGSGSLSRVEILAFFEPEDYKVRDGWLGRFAGKSAEDELVVGRDLLRVTGATLSVQSLSASVRRALALHAVVSEGDES